VPETEDNPVRSGVGTLPPQAVPARSSKKAPEILVDDLMQAKSPILHLIGIGVLAGRCLLPYPRHDDADGLMGDTHATRHAPQAFAFSPRGDLMPALGWNARPFSDRRIPANPRPSSRVEQSLGIQEGH
jgi:hypothetical protein